MSELQKCFRCGAELSRLAPGGHCLRCVLELGLSGDDVPTLAPSSSDQPPKPAVPGDRIGRYKLLQQIGEGGCGIVYMADQEEPIRRRIALKVIKPGMDTREVLARFDSERQALALMDHPNIARVLDAGATESKQPFFAMELVRGIPITRYCDKNKLNTGQRLELFIQVCQAIQHAHQKGIIHRDIKPSNILVADHDGVPMPKIIDFGIAKATVGQTLTDKTVFTAFEQFIGTPAYMSPEQAKLSGLDIDTRSDIYSLGVLLYELLTGKTPFDGRKLLDGGFDDIRRIVREEEPPRPSRKLSTLAAPEQTTTATARQTDSPRLIHLIRGDLDWIVMKCLEKERNRRYPTANALASDILHHIHNEPVTARPPSQIYRFQKLVRRNKLPFAAATAALLALVIGLGFSTWSLLKERQARQRALIAEERAVAQSKNAKSEAERAEAETTSAKQRLVESEAISHFLNEVFKSTAPGRDVRTITSIEFLGVAARKVETDLANQPARRAQIEAMLAENYSALGLFREAAPLGEKVRDYYLATFGPEDPATLFAMQNLGSYYYNGGRLYESLELRENVLRLFRKVSGPESNLTLWAMNHLASCYFDVGRWDEALKLREDALRLRRKISGPEHSSTLFAMTSLASSYDQAGRRDEALKLREDALTLSRKVNGPEDLRTLRARSSLATSYEEAGRMDEALKMREELLAFFRRAFGMEYPDTLWEIQNLAITYDVSGRRDEALKLREEVLPLCRKVNGPEYNSTLWAMTRLAISYDEVGRPDDALRLREQVLPLRRKANGPKHPYTLGAMKDLADSYCSFGRDKEAIALLEDACQSDPKNTLGMLTLATWQTWFGQDADYEATRRQLLQQAEGTNNAPQPEQAAMACCLRPSTDAALLMKVLNLAQRTVELGKNDPGLPADQLALGLAEYRNGQYAAAEQTLTVAEQTAGKFRDIPETARLFRAMSLFRQNRLEEARRAFGQAAAQMPPLPADERKPLANGMLASPGVLMCWLACKEAKSLLNEPAAAKP